MRFINLFFLSSFISFLISFLIFRIAHKLKIFDYPDSSRKIHTSPTPLLGGLSIFITFTLLILALNIKTTLFTSLFLGGLILHFIGFLDDKYKLSPFIQLSGVLTAVLIPIFLGLKINFITNPFYILGISSNSIIVLPEYFKIIFTFIWILILTYATKLLDGLDGLVSGISLIGYLIIFIVSLNYNLFFVSLYSLILAGGSLGFLIWNFYPAKIFLGEGGSTFAGYSLALLAISGTAKISTTLLVLSIPILDLIYVVLSRIKSSQSIFKADNRHLHFRLLKLGLSKKGAVILYWIAAIFLGILGISLNEKLRIIAILLLSFFSIFWYKYIIKK